MQLRIWKRIFLSPWVRLNLYTKGFSISFGHNRLGWLTIGRGGVTGTVPTGIPGVYISQRRPWPKGHCPHRLEDVFNDEEPAEIRAREKDRKQQQTSKGSSVQNLHDGKAKTTPRRRLNP